MCVCGSGDSHKIHKELTAVLCHTYVFMVTEQTSEHFKFIGPIFREILVILGHKGLPVTLLWPEHFGGECWKTVVHHV